MVGVSAGQPVLLSTNCPNQHHRSAIDFLVINSRPCIVVIVKVYFTISSMPKSQSKFCPFVHCDICVVNVDAILDIEGYFHSRFNKLYIKSGLKKNPEVYRM